MDDNEVDFTKLKYVLYARKSTEDEDGIFVASVPALQGCYTEGDTFEEAVKNAEDVITLHVASRKERGEIIDDSNTEFVGIKNFSLPYGVSTHR